MAYSSTEVVTRLTAVCKKSIGVLVVLRVSVEMIILHINVMLS